MPDLATTAAIYHRPAHGGDEQDAFSRPARRALAAFTRPGIAAATKTRAGRRDRRSTRATLRTLAA